MPSIDRARPYPWSALEKVSRDDAEAARAMRRWGARFARAGEAADALSSLLHARVRLEVSRVRAVDRPAGSEGSVAAIVAAADAADVAHAAIVEAEGALAAAIVARAIRRPTPAVLDGSQPAGHALAGAFAAVIAALARRLQADRAVRVIAAGPAPYLARDAASAAGGPMIEAQITARVDDDAFIARVTVPRALASAASDAPWSLAALHAIDDAPLAIPIVAAATRSTAAEVGSLRRGDAWLPGAWPLRATEGGSLAGPVLLCAPASERAIRADLGDDGRLVLRGGVEPLSWTAREEDDVSEDKDALVEAVGEVPVIVRVEIGVAEMRAREWAAMGRGDVIALGRKLGEPVTLRVGGVAVARGELVDLEGEIGVRILGRTEER